VYASATASVMLQGKHYAREIRGIRLVHEAMSHLYLSSAESFASTNGLPWLDDKTLDLLKELKMSFEQENHPSSVALCGEIEHKLSSVTETIAKFPTAGRDNSATYAYWDSFLETGNILLRLLRADREANFQLHLESVMETVPYFMLAGHVNYAWYTPVYVAEMKQLRYSHPAAFDHMMDLL